MLPKNWLPYCFAQFLNMDLNMIESVQIQFLLFCLRHLGNDWGPNKRLSSNVKCLALIKLLSESNFVSELYSYLPDSKEILVRMRLASQK